MPIKRHMIIEEAREESRRLAKGYPGVESFVLRAVEGVTYKEQPYTVRNFKKQKGEDRVYPENFSTDLASMPDF